MQGHTLRWLATPVAIAIACAAGIWLYLETAFGIGVSAGIRCFFGGQEPGSCITPSENLRFWIWTVASGALTGVASVLLAVLAAPGHRPGIRARIRAIAMLIPPIAWLWFFDWDPTEATALVLMASSLAAGFISGLLLARGASSPGGVSESR
jgi:hypothetical protein